MEQRPGQMSEAEAAVRWGLRHSLPHNSCVGAWIQDTYVEMFNKSEPYE